MAKNRFRVLLMFFVAFLFLFCGTAFGSEITVEAVADVQKYNRSIHIMAMLLVGFGFLMVFVKKYGLSAITATFLLVATAIPLYMAINGMELFSHGTSEIDRLILAEFAAASLLIAAGAVLGRAKMWQYMLLSLFFIPTYTINEWIVIDGGLGLIEKGSFADTGGSIVIHAFGAFFGLMAAFSMTTKKEIEVEVESDFTSDRFSLLGSMILWIFWPSFCAALVAPSAIPSAVVNVILALCGSTIATYFATVILRKKIDVADIANAALAGGVAIGSTFDHATHIEAMIIGVAAGAISTFGFAVIQEKYHKKLKLVDTCGVVNLHGLPGLFGGLAALLVVSDLNIASQLTGIGISIAIALIFGFISGKIISLFGSRVVPYEDSEEFID